MKIFSFIIILKYNCVSKLYNIYIYKLEIFLYDFNFKKLHMLKLFHKY